MKNLARKIGKVIETERTRLGLTQTQLGKKAKMTQASISEIEDGKRNVSLHNLDSIAEAMKIKLWVLVRRAENLRIKK